MDGMGVPPSPPKKHTSKEVKVPMEDRAINHQRALFLIQEKYVTATMRKLEARKAKEAEEQATSSAKSKQDASQEAKKRSRRNARDRSNVKTRKVGSSNPLPGGGTPALAPVPVSESKNARRVTEDSKSTPDGHMTFMCCSCYAKTHREDRGGKTEVPEDWARIPATDLWFCRACVQHATKMLGLDSLD